MDINLSVLDKAGALLNVSDIVIHTEVIAPGTWTDVFDVNMSLPISIGNTYRIKFTLVNDNYTVLPDLQNGSQIITLTDDNLQGITDAVFVATESSAGLTLDTFPVGPEFWDGTVEVYGEDIQITVDDGNTIQNFTGTNQEVVTVVDDTDVALTIVASGTYSFLNNFRVYKEDVTISVKMIEVITNPLDPEYRKPFPWFFTISEPCSYRVYLYNAQSAPFGTISYQENGTDFAATENAVFDACSPDQLSFTQTIAVNDNACCGCGGTPAILWEIVSAAVPVIISEHKPSLTLENPLLCCMNLNEEFTTYPASMNLYFTAPTAFCTNMSLVYTLIDANGDDVTSTSYNHAQLTGYTNLNQLPFTYLPTALGSYTLKVELANCCITTVYEFPFDVCNSWVVSNSDCNKIVITNLSKTIALDYSIKELTDQDVLGFVTIDSVIQDTISLAADTSIEIDLVSDNIYTVTIDGEEYVFLLDCNIKKCKKGLLNDYLCSTDNCDDLTRAESAAKLNRYVAFENIVYGKWDEWKYTQTIYQTLNINDILEDMIYISELLDEIGKICVACGYSTTCNNEARCSYTLTNFGYLVPTRFHSIIYNKTSGDCGCS